MKLSTSTRISLGFTLLTLLIVSAFSFVVYELFNRNWQRNESAILTQELRNATRWPRTKRPLWGRLQQTLVLLNTDPLISTLGIDQQSDTLSVGDNMWEYTLITIEERTYVYDSSQTHTVFRDITQHTRRQQKLRQLFLFAILGASALSFLLGRWFVRWAMRDIRQITSKIKDLHIDELSFWHQLDHLPEDDEMRTLARTLQDMASSLDTQVDDMRQFVSHAAHELRTPLMILRSSTDVAIKTKQYEQQLPQIQDTIQSMDELISTLLTLARSRTNGFEMWDIAPAQVLESVISQLQTKRSTKNISLSMHLDETVRLHAHPGSLERILHNIIDNAYKYTPEGGEIVIDLDATQLSVANTGTPIPAADLASIRQPFWQADESRGQDTWFGLGLALVQRLVDLHDRDIQATSTQEDGTIFSIIFDVD